MRARKFGDVYRPCKLFVIVARELRFDNNASTGLSFSNNTPDRRDTLPVECRLSPPTLFVLRYIPASC